MAEIQKVDKSDPKDCRQRITDVTITVGQGDSLDSIARSVEVDPRLLHEANTRTLGANRRMVGDDYTAVLPEGTELKYSYKTGPLSTGC